MRFQQHYDADFHGFLAHMDAYNAGVLHRDISPGNIIIGPDHVGRLIDWDSSKPLSLQPETPRRATQVVPTHPSSHYDQR